MPQKHLKSSAGRVAGVGVDAGAGAGRAGEKSGDRRGRCGRGVACGVPACGNQITSREERRIQAQQEQQQGEGEVEGRREG